MDKRKRILNILQVIVFLLIIGAGTGAVVLGACEGKTYSELEKRELAEFPQVKAKGVFDGSFESAFDEALSDHFYGRDALVTAKTWMEILLGKREIDGIYIDGERLIETYSDSDFDDRQIEENISHVTGFMANVAASVGEDHVKLALVPSKCTVYRDHLPDYMPTSKRADTVATEIREALAEKMATGVTTTTAEEVEPEEEEPDEEGFDFGDDDEELDETGFDFGDDEEDSDDDVDSEMTDAGDDGDRKDSSADDAKSAGAAGGSTRDDGASSMPASRMEEMKEKADRMVVDLRPVLAAHGDDYIYYLTDHHWTSLGARYAYQAMMGAEAAPSDTEPVADDFLGTDYNRIHYYKNKDVIDRYRIPEADASTIEINDAGDISKKDSIYAGDALKTADKYNYFFSGNYSRITVNTGTKNGKTLLLVKDSFSNSLAPFLCKDYERIIMVDLRYVNSAIYDYLPEDEMPDDVWIVYNEEKFMQDTHQNYLE